MFVRRKVSFQWFRFISLIILFTFGSNIIGEDAARAWSISEPHNIFMPPPGVLISSSPALSLPTLKAISIDLKDPFKINFVVDSANQSLSEEKGQEQVNLLIKYFLSFLTIPEEDLWVNLSPYEKNRIITSEFEITNAGRDMLVQDYILKQLASSLTYPDHEIGKAFWKKVLIRTQAQYGTSNIPVTSFNKVWVVPDRAVVYEENGSAYIAESRLKVLTEEDYLSIAKHNEKTINGVNHISSEITREIIIPELTREVNEGKYFAPLRQMYNSLILAIWFKKRFKASLIGQVYVNQRKTVGISLSEKKIKDKIYTQYLKAFKKGVYNYIKEDEDPISNQVIPRKYFSGGFSFAMIANRETILPASRLSLSEVRDHFSGFGHKIYHIAVQLSSLGGVSNKQLLGLLAGATLMAGVQQAHASSSDNLPALPSVVQSGSYTNTQPLIAVQKAINKVSGNTGSLLGIHPGDMGYEDVQRIIDAIDYLPSNSPIQAHAQELKKALFNPEFYAYNLNERNQGILHGDYFLTHSNKAPKSKADVDNGIKLLKKEISNLLSSTMSAPVGADLVSAHQPAVPAPVVAAPAVASPTAPATPVPVVPSALVAPTPTAPASAPTVPSSLFSTAPTPVTGVTPSLAGTGPAYSITNSLTPIFTHGTRLAVQGGYVTDLNRTNFYNAGDQNLFIYNLNVEKIVKDLTFEVAANQADLLKKQALFEKNEVSFNEVTLAQQRLSESSQKLAEALQERSVGVVTSPYNSQIDTRSVKNGMFVTPGQVLFTDYNLQRVSFTLSVKPSVSPSEFDNFTVNGIRVKSIVSIDRSKLDNQKKNALWTVVVEPAQTLLKGQPVGVKADVLPPDIYYPSLSEINSPFSTLSAVGPVQQYPVHVPDGWVKRLVSDGNTVQEGQVIAIEFTGHDYEDYRNTRLALSGIDYQISRAKDLNGNPRISNDDLLKLNIQRNTLSDKLQQLQVMLQLLVIRAPASGVLSGANAQTGVFQSVQSTDTFLTVQTGTAEIGNLDAPGLKPVYVPQGWNLNQDNYPVIVQAGGARFPGEVTQVNSSTNLSSLTMSFSGSQGVEIKFYGKAGIVQSNLPVNIIWPTNDLQKRIISEALSLAKAASGNNNVSAGAPPPPDDPIINSAQPFNPGVFALTGSTSSTNLPQGAVTINMIESQVASNPLNFYLEESAYNKRKLAINSAYDVNLSFFGGPVMSGNQIKWNYGIAGMFANSLQGGLQSGNAINAAAPVVSSFFINLIPILDGEAHKQTKINEKESQKAKHHEEAVKLSVADVGAGLGIEIGGAQTKLESLKALQKQLEDAQRVIEARKLAGGISTESESVDIAKKVLKNAGEIRSLQDQMNKWTLALNFLRGQTNSLNSSIAVFVPWGKEFGSISQQTTDHWLRDLTGTNSLNPEIAEAGDDFYTAKKSAVLAGLKDYLPALNVVGVNDSTTNSVSGSPVGLSPDESKLRTPGLKPDLNADLGGSVTIYSSARERKQKMLAQDVIAAHAVKEKKIGQLKADLLTAVNHINGLSQEIQLAQSAYDKAYQEWQSKALMGDVNLFYTLVNDRIEIYRLFQDLINLKMQYLNEEATLRQLSVSGPETSTQGISLADLNRFQTVVSNSIPGSLGTVFPSLTTAYVLTNNFDNFSNASSTGPLTPGVITYSGDDLTSDWPLMQADSLEAIVQVIIHDTNPDTRMKALDHFLAEYQDQYKDKKELFYTAVHEILGQAPSEIVLKFLTAMEKGEDYGIKFYIETINNAETNNNQMIADLGLQQLGYAFTMHPEALNKLRLTDFNNKDIANKVIVTFLLRQPDISIAVDNLIKNSDFLKTLDLKGMHDNLTAYAVNHQGEAGIDKINKLTGLIKDLVGNRFEKSGISEAFRPDGFANMPHVWFSWLSPIYQLDMITAVQIENETNWNAAFLKYSSSWREPEKFVYTNLYLKAKNDLRNLFSGSSKLSSDVPFFKFSALSVDHHELDYFQSQGLEGQQEFIADPVNIPLVAIKILPLQTAVRGEILDSEKCPVMKDRQGRLLVLNTYVNSSDSDLRSLIESYKGWESDLKVDIPRVDGAVNNQIIRQALGIMYTNTHNEVYLKLRLLTYTPPELHLAKEDPQLKDDTRWWALVDAKMRVVAIKMAKEVLEKETEHRHIWHAGYSLRMVSVMDELRNIQDDLDNEIDPEKVISNIDPVLRGTNDSEVRAMLENLKEVSDKILPKIKDNDQTFPKIPTFWWKKGGFVVLSVVLGGLFTYLRISSKRAKIKEQNKDNLNNILYIANKVTSLEHMDNLNGSENNEPRMDKIEKRDDGLRIIRMPEPVYVEPKAQIKLRTWWRIVFNWNESTSVSKDEVVRDFHQIKEFALDALKTIPYEPSMMLSPSGQRQKTLFYYTTLANYTLYMLSMELANRNLTPDQEVQLKQDIDDFVNSIEYAINFSLVLHYRSNIQRVLNRRLPEDHPLEKSRWWLLGYSLYGLARAYLLFEYLYSKSLKGSNEALDSLLDQGKKLMGLYQNKEEIKIKGKNYLDSVIVRGGMEQTARSHDAEIKDKIGNFWREIHYPFEAAIILLSTIASLIFLPGIAVFTVGISFYTLVRHSYSVWFYAKPNLDFLNTTWSKEINDLARKQQDVIIGSRANSAMISQSLVANRPGGVDFSKVENSIQFKMNSLIGSNISLKGRTSLGYFRGFEFQVIKCQPIVNPDEFF